MVTSVLTKMLKTGSRFHITSQNCNHSHVTWHWQDWDEVIMVDVSHFIDMWVLTYKFLALLGPRIVPVTSIVCVPDELTSVTTRRPPMPFQESRRVRRTCWPGRECCVFERLCVDVVLDLNTKNSGDIRRWFCIFRVNTRCEPHTPPKAPRKVCATCNNTWIFFIKSTFHCTLSRRNPPPAWSS